jgi:aryl-alcohol dehydrogenase-like predicted oxidoreductase
MRQIEETLRRLKTDYLDVYYMHHPDIATPIEQSLRTMDDLIRSGKVRYCALSTYNSGQMVEALWMADRYNLNAPVCHQHSYNLINRNIEREIVPFCLKYGLTLNLFGPVHGGLLASRSVLERQFQGSQRWAGPGFSEADIAKAQQLWDLSEEVGIPPGHLAIAWLLSRPAVSAAIIGPETLEELEQNLPAGDLELPADLMERVDAIGRPEPMYGFAR